LSSSKCESDGKEAFHLKKLVRGGCRITPSKACSKSKRRLVIKNHEEVRTDETKKSCRLFERGVILDTLGWSGSTFRNIDLNAG